MLRLQVITEVMQIKREMHIVTPKTLSFFGLEPDMTVLEVSPGGIGIPRFLRRYYRAGQVDCRTSPDEVLDRRSLGRYLQKLGENNDITQVWTCRSLQPHPPSTAAGSVDLALVFECSSWLRAGNADAALADIFRSLKPGVRSGLFSIEERRHIAR